jgi:hypothetical protein
MSSLLRAFLSLFLCGSFVRPLEGIVEQLPASRTADLVPGERTAACARPLLLLQVIPLEPAHFAVEGAVFDGERSMGRFAAGELVKSRAGKLLALAAAILLLLDDTLPDTALLRLETATVGPAPVAGQIFGGHTPFRRKRLESSVVEAPVNVAGFTEEPATSNSVEVHCSFLLAGTQVIKYLSSVEPPWYFFSPRDLLTPAACLENMRTF